MSIFRKIFGGEPRSRQPEIAMPKIETGASTPIQIGGEVALLQDFTPESKETPRVVSAQQWKYGKNYKV